MILSVSAATSVMQRFKLFFLRMLVTMDDISILTTSIPFMNIADEFFVNFSTRAIREIPFYLEIHP